MGWAQDAGMATGVVTTARVTHATPAATYAHVADRDWECGVPDYAANPHPAAKDVAWQLVNTSPGDKLRVVLGGGKAAFRPFEQYGEAPMPDLYRVSLYIHHVNIIDDVESKKIKSMHLFAVR